MIAETPQLICCFISTKTEILRDHAAPCARPPRGSPPTALTLTTHHLSQRHCRSRRDHCGARLGPPGEMSPVVLFYLDIQGPDDAGDLHRRVAKASRRRVRAAGALRIRSPLPDLRAATECNHRLHICGQHATVGCR
jgi:hypothetical protein